MIGTAPLRVVSLDAKIDDETFGVPVNCAGYPYLTAYITGNGTTSSGVITFEEADWDPSVASQIYSVAGGWSSITTVNASDVTGGLQKAVHFPVGAYAFIRPRISTVIGGGGSVTVVIRGDGA